MARYDFDNEYVGLGLIPQNTSPMIGAKYFDKPDLVTKELGGGLIGVAAFEIYKQLVYNFNKAKQEYTTKGGDKSCGENYNWAVSTDNLMKEYNLSSSDMHLIKLVLEDKDYIEATLVPFFGYPTEVWFPVLKEDE